MDITLSTERIKARIEDGIGWMIFNNPARHNALSLEMWRGMSETLTQFATNDDVRVVVMRGAGGKAFVSGADISEFDNKRSNASQQAEYAETAGHASKLLNQLEKPLIALIEGFCIGGGLATALAADVRMATPDSRFGIPAAKLGLGYEYGGLAKLARVVGPSSARDILFSARFLEADEALRIGLINFIASRDDIEAECLAYAQRIAGNAPLTVKAAKAALNVWERGGREADVAAVEGMVKECFDSEDYKEGRRAFKEKRTPLFNGQ